MRNLFVLFCFYFGFVTEFGLSEVSSFKVSRPSRVTGRRTYSRPSGPLCPYITLKNGIARSRGARSRVVRFFCNPGYMLAGEKHSSCVRNQWDPAPPLCVRPTCKTIAQQTAGENLLVHLTHNKAVQHFFCKAGFSLKGPRVTYCDGMKWSDNLPICLPGDAKPQLSCDFETTDLCGWTPDLNHDFDWLRESYNTPSGSIGTGPSFDHTLGPGQGGHYMYIESSSKAENDTARLISPVFEKIDGEICFEFFYHMFGATIGTLRVYLKDVNQSWDLNSQLAFFSMSGNQGDRWYRSLTHLGIVNDEFQIIIEGVRGSGYVSDIAIDDVKIIANCTDEEETTTMMESSTFNELIPTVDSCENRCGQIESTTNETAHLSCDCDEDCFVNSRCCPDYYDICSGTTVVDEFEASGENDSPTNETVWTTPDVTLSNKTPKVTNTTSEMPTRNFTFRGPTTPIKRISVRPLKPTTTSTRLVQSSTPRVLVNPTKMPPKVYPNFTRPVIRLQTPPPTSVIYRKILKTTTSKPFILKPTKEIDTEDTDELEVPRPTDNDEGIFDVAEGAAKEFWSDEIENNVDTPFERNFNETKKLLSQTSVEKAGPNYLIPVVSLLVVLVIISVVSFVLIRRYRFSRGFMSSNGQSQSDVRYLTSDDVLNFSLPECYSDDVH